MSTSEHRTRPTGQRGPGIAVRTLRVEVVEGPDAEKLASPVTSEDEEIHVGTDPTNHLVLNDPTVSRFHATFRAVPDGILLVDRGSTNGISVSGVIVERGVVRAGTTLRIGQTRLRVSHGLPGEVDLFPGAELEGILGSTETMRRLMSAVGKIASSSVPALVMGESGTGKELVAHAIHRAGGERKGPFVTVDCGALPGSLLASELFGHERGAFTGAERTRKGAFELADGGTLFLDEIGELPLEHQATLLGALERRRFKRVGGSNEIAVNVRVVAATHRDLPSSVNQRTFRLDLYHRLAVVVLKLPPLRERVDDIPVLARHFAGLFGATDRFDELFPEPTLEQLKRHSWPGNVRELRNVVEATLALGSLPGAPLGATEARGPDLDANSYTLPEALLRMPYHQARARLVGMLERQAVELCLRECGGNVSSAARRMGINRSHLYGLLDRHRLASETDDEA